MKTTPLIVACLISLMLASCSKNQQKIVSHQVSENSIPISANVLSNYPIANVLITDSAEYYIGYNHFDHSLDFFDLTNNKVSHQIQLQREGPKGTGKASRFVVSSENIIVSNPNGDLYAINQTGDIIWKSDSIIGNYENNKHSLRYQGISFLNFDYPNEIVDNKLIVNFYPNLSRSDNHFYDNINVGIMNVNQLSFNILPPIQYPKSILEDDYQGELDKPHFSINPSNQIICSFSSSEEIIIIDLNSGKYTFKQLESPETPDLMAINYDEKDFEMRYQHLKKSARFFPLLYHTYGDFYFRITKKETNEENFYAKSWLYIYDSSFKLKESIKLPESTGIHAHSTEQGIIIPFNSGALKTENTFKYLLIKVD